MKSMKVHLKNVYGIRKLKHTFNFEKCSSAIIYAPNGSMKSSLANTFRDIINNENSCDRIFSDRKSNRVILDGAGRPINPKSVFVVGPVDKEFGVGKRTSMLLVNSELRKEYEDLTGDSDEAKSKFVSKLKNQFNLDIDVEKEISLVFTQKEDKFQDAVIQISYEVDNQHESQFSDVPYDIVFNDKVEDALNNPEVQEALKQYVSHFNSLIEKSEFFRHYKFTYYDAQKIADALDERSFFESKHAVKLVGKNRCIEVTSKSKFEDLINKEKK